MMMMGGLLASRKPELIYHVLTQQFSRDIFYLALARNLTEVQEN